jgi:hypothetical protein
MDSGFDRLHTVAPVIVVALAEELKRAVDLLTRIGDAEYTAKSRTSGSVGGHFRHNLNFVEAVLSGARLGRIDYAKRLRDVRLEADREYAAERFNEAIARLMRLTVGEAAKEVSVVSEVDGSVAHRSSVGRELEFAHSHTVHHHALIAEKLWVMGVEVDVLFGVAPSTKRYWEAQQMSVR